MRIRRQPRHGLSLLEVMLSLVIFLMALIGLGQLMTICTNQAIEIKHLNHASQLLQSKMNEVVAGVIPLTGQGDTSFDEDPDWSWSLECDAEGTPNLWRVTVTVTFKSKDGSEAGPWSLSELVLDPAARGAIEPPATTPSTTPTGGP